MKLIVAFFAILPTRLKTLPGKAVLG